MKKYLVESGVAWLFLLGLGLLGYIWGGWKVAVTFPLVLILLGAGALINREK